MEKNLDLRLWQKGIIVTLLTGFAFIGVSSIINNLENQIKEEIAHEQLLEQRRNKIDSLRITELNITEDGTTR